MSGYLAWDEKWAQGMQAAEPYMRERAAAQRQMQTANRARGAKRPCGIKGCKRHSYKGRLCRLHWQMVPTTDKVRLTVACMEAQMREADRQHRRFLRDLQAKLA